MTNDLTQAAEALRAAAEKCCQCTDGHHDWAPAYGTDRDVRLSRDAAVALAELLEGLDRAVGREGIVVSGTLHTMGLDVASGVLLGDVPQ